jgi:UMF1 family MFS transporter
MTTGRAVSFVSPLLWTTAISAALAMGVENAQATIYGILGLMVVLVVGTLLLATVDPKPQVITD